jgi:hypothetical protein
MVEKEHRARHGTFVEPGELAAKERQRGAVPRGAPTLPLSVLRPEDAAAASVTNPDAVPGSAETDPPETG